MPFRRPPDESHALILVGIAAGLTHEQIGEALGLTRQTIGLTIAKTDTWFKRLIPQAKAIAARRVQATVEKELISAEARLKRLFDRSFCITEKVLDKAEAAGDNITIQEAMDIHKSITQWAAKFAASEAPKRLSVEGTVNHDHRAVPSHIFDAIDSVLREQRALPPAIEVQEAEVVQ